MNIQKLLLVCAVSALNLSPLCIAQFAVHDPAQTAQTVAQMTKQLEAWGKQFEQMEGMIDLSNQITEYSEELNGFIGDAKEAAGKIVEAQAVIERLSNLTKIKDLDELEAEIGSLIDITEVKEVINTKSEIYGKLEEKVNGVEVTRDTEKYKKHALTTARYTTYEEERSTTVDELEVVQTDLAKAVEKAQTATNQSEQLAVLTEIESLNARLNILLLRHTVASSDLEAQVLANQDRQELEDLNNDDINNSLLKASLDEQVALTEAQIEKTKVERAASRAALRARDN